MSRERSFVAGPETDTILVKWLATEAAARALSGSEFVVTDRTRRVLSVLMALVAVPLLVPLGIIIAVLIRLDSPGPIIFSQGRVGANRRAHRSDSIVSSKRGRRKIDHGGRLFRMYAFRTMYVGHVTNSKTLRGRMVRLARALGWLPFVDPVTVRTYLDHELATDFDRPQIWSRGTDLRVTPIGRVLRKYRLDLLPALFNVLKGDMNVVGPIPEPPAVFRQLKHDIPGFESLMVVLPGITGWSQIHQEYDSEATYSRRKVELDLDYISRRSAHLDLIIIARTIPSILFASRERRSS